MKTIACVTILFLAFFAGIYIGKARERPIANVEGRKFGFGLGLLYCSTEDKNIRSTIETLFPEEISYAKQQEHEFKRRMKEGGLHSSKKLTRPNGAM